MRFGLGSGIDTGDIQAALDGGSGTTDVDLVTFDAEELDQLASVGDIVLFTIRHENTNNAVFAAGFDTKSGHEAGIFTAGDAYNGITAGTILAEVFTNPADKLLLDRVDVKSIRFGLGGCEIFGFLIRSP